MKRTENLNLPIYDNPESDIFKINDVNNAHKAIDKQYKELKNIKETVESTNPSANLQGQINGINVSLEHIANDIPLYANKQLVNTHKFISKINDNVVIKVVCQGDSLTHGQDTFSSDKRNANLDATRVDGGSDDVTIGSSTYPEVLQSALQEVYGGRINVIKRGYCGDTVKLSYDRWANNPKADIHILMFGTNDAGLYSNINELLADYYELIKRILTWGSCVVILTPPKKGGYDSKISLFEELLKELGRVLNIPVIDTVDFYEGYENSYIYGSYEEGVHFNGNGYYILGSRLASLFVGNKSLISPQELNSGDVLMGAKQLNYVVYSGTTKPTFLDYGDRTMWGGNALNEGSIVIIPPNSRINFSFKTTSTDMLLIPILTSGTNARCEITLDFNNLQPKALSSLIDDKISRTELKPVAKGLLFDVGQEQRKGILDFKLSDINNTVLRIVQKGYHSVKVKNVGSADNVRFEGFLSIDLNTFKLLNKITFNEITLLNGYSINGYDNSGNKIQIGKVSTGVELGDKNVEVVDIKSKTNIFAWGNLLPNHTLNNVSIGATWGKWYQGHFSNGVSTGSGTTRPSSPSKGMIWFDENLGKPIFYKGSSVWVDANGTVV